VDYLFFRLRGILDAIDRWVDRWWRGSLPDDEVIDPLTRQMERESMEKLAEWESAGGDSGGD
jgi:succinylarginine dihydrolase